MAKDTEVGGIIAPVRADISDFIRKFDQVNEKANVVSGNLVAKIDEVLNAQKKLNAQGNTFKNNIFASQDNLSNATIARINNVITAQDRLSLKTRQLATDIAKGGGSDILVKDVNSVIVAQERLNSVLNKPLSSNRIKEIQLEVRELNNKLVKLQEIKLMEERFPGTSGNQISSINAQIQALTRSKQVRQEILEIQRQTNLTANNAPKVETINSSQYTDGIKKAKQDIAAIDRQLFEQLQRNNGVESQRTAELRRQKSEIEAQLGALRRAEGIDRLTAQQVKYGTAINANNQFLQQMKSHLTWMATAGAVMSAFTIPSEAISRIKEMESAMAGVRQVLPSIERDQAAANAEAQKFISIASQYGESVDKIIDAGRSWGRMYKDVNTVNLLVSQSAKMAVADNFDVGQSVKGLESAMAQFGMKTEDYNEILINSSRILDVWTKLAHTGAASAQDLTAATERAGSSAKQMGVSFEFFNALVSTGVRNTALSGDNIGNSLKSMFNSIQSTKAIKEIEKLGVSVYQFNADGTKSFRDVQQVILDLSLAIQSTTKDTSALELAIGGGKFQVSKITSIMTDYKEIIRLWEAAVNSAGFTDQQVSIQMETLARKSKSLKAEMDNVFNSAGNSGLTKNLKDITESMTNFVRGMNEGAESITFLVKWSLLAGVPLYALAKAIQGVAYYNGFVTMSTKIAAGATADGMSKDIAATVAKTGLTAAMRNQAAAAGMVAATTGLVTRGTALLTAASMGWIGIALTLAGVIYSVVSSYGELSRAQEKNVDTIDKRNEKAVGQLAQSKQQAEFITTLSERYISLGDEIKNNSGSTEENTKKIEQQNVILDALSRQSGLTTDELVKDGVLQVSAIEEATKAKKQQAKDSIQADIDKTAAEIVATNKSIEATQTRIDKMKIEMKNVGLLGKAYEWLMSKIALGKIKKAEELEKVADGNGDIRYSLYNKIVSKEQMRSDAKTLREGADSYIDKSGQAGIDILTGQITNATQKLAPQIEGLNNLSKSLEALDREAPKTKGIIEDNPNKNKKEKSTPGENMKEPDIRTQQFNDKSKSMEVNKMFDEAKMRADQYAMALDIVNTKESLIGITAESSKQRQDIMKKQIDDLLASAMEYQDMASDYEQQANDMVAANNDLEASLKSRKESWSGMTKEQKLAFVELNKDHIKDVNSMNNLIELSDKLKVKSSEASKAATKTAGDAVQKDISDAKNKYDTAIQRNNLNKENALLGLGNDYTKEQADVIELMAAVNNLHLAKERLKALEEEPGGKDNPAYKQQLVTIGQLTNQVDTLGDKTRVIRQNMATMFDGMMRGTTSFKDFWKNAWMDMATEAINNIWKVNNAGSSSSFLGGIFKSLFGSSSKTDAFTLSNGTKLDPNFGFKIDGAKEGGGPVQAGKTYLVGEKRPELFVPDRNGSIIPDLNGIRSASSANADAGNTINNQTVNINQTFNGQQDSSIVAQIRSQKDWLISTVEDAMNHRTSTRNAVKRANK